MEESKTQKAKNPDTGKKAPARSKTPADASKSPEKPAKIKKEAKKAAAAAAGTNDA
jgi:hypothetical protein